MTERHSVHILCLSDCLERVSARQSALSAPALFGRRREVTGSGEDAAAARGGSKDMVKRAKHLIRWCAAAKDVAYLISPDAVGRARRMTAAGRARDALPCEGEEGQWNS